MLTLIPDLPPGVVGVEARGKVTADDYEQVLGSAVEAAQTASADGRARMLYVLGDTRLGPGHPRSWERIAIVTDADWLRHPVHRLGWMMPGEVRVFGTKDIDEARSWALA